MQGLFFVVMLPGKLLHALLLAPKQTERMVL